jgi:CRP/FNR family transcriptional regulator, cyclic AMP receptor protein
MELSDLGTELAPGRIFGEIALFSPSRVRTQAVRCLSPCTVLEIDESTVRQLFFQDPPFAFHLVELLAERLSGDVERAESRARAAARPQGA